MTKKRFGDRLREWFASLSAPAQDTRELTRQEARAIGDRQAIQRVGDAFVIRQCPIPKDEVLSGDLHSVEPLVQSVADELKEHGTFQPWNLTISGYDTDPRGLWEIPEVRAWYQQAFARFPYLPSLLSSGTAGPFVLCLLEVEIAERRKRPLTAVEQQVIDLMRKTNPVEARRMAESLATQATVRIKSDEEKVRLVTEIVMASTEFFTENVSDPSLHPRLIVEVGDRIGRGLAGM